MRRTRTLFALLLALAVTMLPLSDAFAHVMSGMPSHGAGCCKSDTPCEKQWPACPSYAGCTLKCFNLSGALLPTADAGIAVWKAKRPIASDMQLHVQPLAPPLPPPRV
ncbi:MAG TPA: hypothetical protein VNJ31_05585 [Methyloceanibacter sp.]|nr:hypothetical protein [Methyloceanibacter sp.]